LAPSSPKSSRPMKTTSRETLVFLLLLVSIATAGFNSGNNLLYLISGVMLGGLLVSYGAGRINLSRLKARRLLPKRAFAGHPFRIVLEVSNGKRFQKSFGISLDEGTNGQAPLFFMSIENGGKESMGREILLDRRGIFRFPPLALRSAFPFGLFNLKKGKASEIDEIIVYPRIYDIETALGGSSHIRDEFPTHLKGPGSGLYGFREYRHGEEATNISWKLSAKLGRLIVRETEHEERHRVCIVFDSVLKDNSKAAMESFERAVSGAASLVWYLCRNNYSVKLITRDKAIGYGSGPDQMHRMLVVLALIEPILAGTETPAVGRSVFEGGAGVLVTSADARSVAGKAGGGFSLIIPGAGKVERP